MSLAASLKSLSALAALQASLPLTAGMAASAWLRTRGEGNDRELVAEPKRVLISGAKMTKALVLARAFSAAGHKVVMTESKRYALAAHRFSDAVDAFEVLPENGDPHYAAALKALIRKHEVDVYLPVTSPAGSLHDSALVPELSQLCEVLHVGPEHIAMLDDKAAFAKAARKAGLRVPETRKVTSVQQVLNFDFGAHSRPFILKRIAYDPVGRLDLTRLPLKSRAETETYVQSLGISEDNPFVLQEFIEGRELCTHGFFREGRLAVHCCCVSSPFQVNYEHVYRLDIQQWVETFGQSLGFTGQASFDFIEADDDGAIYAIECNPRTHSAITLFAGDERLVDAYLDSAAGEGGPIEPRGDAEPTYWAAHEAWRMLSGLGQHDAVTDSLCRIARGRDAVLDPHDPLPFLALHHIHIPVLLARSALKGRDWHHIDFNIGKLVQNGGD